MANYMIKADNFVISDIKTDRDGNLLGWSWGEFMRNYHWDASYRDLANVVLKIKEFAIKNNIPSDAAEWELGLMPFVCEAGNDPIIPIVVRINEPFNTANYAKIDV